MHVLIPLALAALITLAPSAVQAQDDTPMAYGDADCIECSGPVDEPVPYGEDGCIDCTSAPPQTCMDGAQDGETCQDDVQYFGPGPADTGVDPEGQPELASSDDDSKGAGDAGSRDLPVVPLGLLGAVVLVLAVLARRR